MITPKPFPISRQSYLRFTVVFVIGYVIIYGMAIILHWMFGAQTTKMPVWYLMLVNVAALMLTEIGMALGGWVSVTDGIIRHRRLALIFVLGFVFALGLLSQQEWVMGMDASAGRLTEWLPWVWYLVWLASMKPKRKSGVEASTIESVE